MLRTIFVMLLATLLTLTGCGGSDSDSKADACDAWDKAMRVDREFMASTDDPVLPDTGDIVADTEAAMEDLDRRLDELVAANKAAKDAFSKAAAEDPEWEDVQAAAYEHLSSGEGEGKAMVEAACDRLSQQDT